jgi:hypothetical protein
MHLTELELRLRSCPLGKRCVADDVSERLPGEYNISLDQDSSDIRLTSLVRTPGTPFSSYDRE